MTPQEWNSRPRIISVVVDNDSPVIPHAREFVDWCNKKGDQAKFCSDYDAIAEGTCAFYLGCLKITPPEILKRNKYNLVVHASDLPEGRGFAPMTWQILEGKNTIPFCLIEAVNEVDAGDIYIKDYLELDGLELCDELRRLQGEKSIELCKKFLTQETPPKGKKQEGKATIYPRRRPVDSRLDICKTILEQFNLLRTVDNVRYPAYFEHCGQRYNIYINRVEKDEKK